MIDETIELLHQSNNFLTKKGLIDGYVGLFIKTICEIIVWSPIKLIISHKLEQHYKSQICFDNMLDVQFEMLSRHQGNPFFLNYNYNPCKLPRLLNDHSIVWSFLTQVSHCYSTNVTDNLGKLFSIINFNANCQQFQNLRNHGDQLILQTLLKKFS